MCGSATFCDTTKQQPPVHMTQQNACPAVVFLTCVRCAQTLLWRRLRWGQQSCAAEKRAARLQRIGACRTLAGEGCARLVVRQEALAGPTPLHRLAGLAMRRLLAARSCARQCLARPAAAAAVAFRKSSPAMSRPTPQTAHQAVCHLGCCSPDAGVAAGLGQG